jgi:hypothetical protein
MSIQSSKSKKKPPAGANAGNIELLHFQYTQFALPSITGMKPAQLHITSRAATFDRFSHVLTVLTPFKSALKLQWRSLSRTSTQ